MDYEIVTLEEKILVGISAKTGNSDPNAGAVIGGMWNDFISKEIYASIKNVKSQNPICLYSDYEATDVTGEALNYDVTIGNEVTTADNAGLTVKVIPAGRYAKFFVTGNVATASMQAWMAIWQMPLERSFTGDFEEYLNMSMEDAEIAIYVALKQ